LRLGLRLADKLGKGAYSVVYRCDRNQDGGEDTVAAKVTATAGDDSLAQRAAQEYDILKDISHPNIIRVFSFEKAANEVALIMDFVPGGSLSQCVKQGGALPLDWAHRVAYGLLLALKHLHSLRVLHLDLNPNNVLLSVEGNPVLCDFGSAQLAREGGSIGAVQTPLYSAPEAVADTAMSGDLLDVWGAGCCIFEALLGEVPWKAGMDEEEVVDRVALVNRLDDFADVEIPKIREEKEVKQVEMPPDCWALLTRCLAPAHKRATAREAAENKWVMEFIVPNAVTAEDLWMRRHNPYVGTTWHAPASPFVFGTSSPRTASPTVLPRRKSSQHMADDISEREKELWWSKGSSSKATDLRGSNSPKSPTMTPSQIADIAVAMHASHLSPPPVSRAYPASPPPLVAPRQGNVPPLRERRLVDESQGEAFLQLQLKTPAENPYGLGKSPFDTCIF
jgi:serine/threonine protein kinase